MANANIFQAYLQPPKSVTDYMGEMDAQDIRREQLAGTRQQNALQALTMQQTADTQRRAEAGRQRLAGYVQQAGGDKNALVALLERDPEFMDKAQAIRKGDADVAHVQSQTAAQNSTAAKNQSGVMDDALKRYRGQLDYITSPDAAVRWVQAQYQDPVIGKFAASVMPPEQAVAQIPRDQAGFERWRQEQALGMEKFLQEQRLQGQAAQQARNDLVGPDGQPNQPVIAAKKAIAKEGAPKVEVNTGQKGFDNTLKLRGDFRGEPVYKAHQEMQSAHSQIQQALKAGTPVGDLAGATKIMKLLDPGSVVRESELGMAMAATGLLDRVQSYAGNIMSGAKLTPKQRQDFQALADQLYGESVKAYNAKRQEYQGISDRNGLNTLDVLGPESASPGKPAAQSHAVPADIADILKRHGGK